MNIVMRSIAFDKDERLEALKAKIEEEPATRKAQREGQRILNASLNADDTIRTTNAALISSAAHEDSQYEASTQTLSSDKSTGTRSGPEPGEKDADYFEMVGVAEEGRALLPRRG